jgi:hypothetical protein
MQLAQDRALVNTFRFHKMLRTSSPAERLSLSKWTHFYKTTDCMKPEMNLNTCRI